MGQDSHIQWTHHTFNPWRGCTHVSPGCEHCYAETLSKRNPATLGTWGANGTRAMASESYWRQPERWNRAAEKAGERRRVFCASLADVFEDRPELVWPRARLFALTSRTPHLDWLLLTKRPENARRMIEDLHQLWLADVAPNVWLGTTVEDQRRADERIPILLGTPAAVRFLSCEPLLGPVDLTMVGAAQVSPTHRLGINYLARDGMHLDWLIVGGESGAKARPMDLAWARSLVEQGRAAEVPVFVKQLGARPTAAGHLGPLRHRAGGDPGEWPNELRVRQFPRLVRA